MNVARLISILTTMLKYMHTAAMSPSLSFDSRSAYNIKTKLIMPPVGKTVPQGSAEMVTCMDTENQLPKMGAKTLGSERL